MLACALDTVLMLLVFLSLALQHSASCQDSLILEGKTGGKCCIFRSMANVLFTGFVIDMNISQNHLCNEPSIVISSHLIT